MAQCVPFKFHHVSYTTLIFSKNVQILIVSEFDENRHGSQILRDDSNGEVCFVIRDLKNFWIFTEIMILPFFRKLYFLRVSHSPLLKKNFVPKFHKHTHPITCICNLTQLQDHVGYDNPAKVPITDNPMAIISSMSRMTLTTNTSITLRSTRLPLRNSDL